MYYDRSKHIARRVLFIRELVAKNIIQPEFIRTEDNPADALTKPLPKVAFIKHRNKSCSAFDKLLFSTLRARGATDASSCATHD